MGRVLAKANSYGNGRDRPSCGKPQESWSNRAGNKRPARKAGAAGAGGGAGPETSA